MIVDPERGMAAVVLAALLTGTTVGCVLLVGGRTMAPSFAGDYPLHTDVVATTFWVGEILDPSASDGSQEVSAYDPEWLTSYGGCDGLVVEGVCGTEPRVEDNGFFPSAMQPLENPFYLDLPYDDVNVPENFASRGEVVPWADEAPYVGAVADPSVSLMKNRWVMLIKDGAVCYGQIQDAGPALYNDVAYVFGDDDRRPANKRFNNAGLDVSPALNGCLGFDALNGQNDRVDWAFVDDEDVPEGPWTVIVTTGNGVSR